MYRTCRFTICQSFGPKHTTSWEHCRSDRHGSKKCCASDLPHVLAGTNAKSGRWTEGTRVRTGESPPTDAFWVTFPLFLASHFDPVLKSLPLIDFTETNRVHLIYPVLNVPCRNRLRKQQRPFLSASYQPFFCGVAPNAADLLPHHVPGVTGGSRDADQVLGSFV